MSEIKPVGYVEAGDLRVLSHGESRVTIIRPKPHPRGDVPVYDRAALAAAWEAGREASAGVCDEKKEEACERGWRPEADGAFGCEVAIRALDNPHKGDA